MEKLLAVVVVIAIGATLLAIREARSEVRSRRAVESGSRATNALQRRLDELEEDRRAMDAVLSSMQDGVVLVGPIGGIRLMNSAAEGHLGRRPVTASAIAPSALAELVRTVASDLRTRSVEVQWGTPSRWLHASAVPVGDDGSVLLVLRDETEGKLADAVRRDFVSNASHELKTPVASIRAAAETIGSAAAEDPEAVVRFSRQLERDAVRLSRIVEDLLDLSRLESGSDLSGDVALDTLLLDERERFEEAASGSGVEIRIGVRPVPRVRGSATDLLLLIGNLIDNALRYTKAGGRVDVELETVSGDVAITVKDTGIGIPTRDLPRIFERFYRVDRARSRETGGTGLGLSIVKHVAENHGGTVSVESELGRGSTFSVRLPASPG